MPEGDQRRGAGQDHELVDLVSKALVDPNIHTDLRMRLEREIGELLRGAHDELYGAQAPEVHRRAVAAGGGHLPSVLSSVLVDPNLHADMRMRIYREIDEMLGSARSSAQRA